MEEGRELLGAREVREVLERHGVRPSKALGQNFVIDPNTIRKVIAAAALDGSEEVLEIGAGCGSLTVGLARSALRVVAVEFDRRLVGALTESTHGLGNVDVVEADALSLDLSSMNASAMVGNLPYNIAVPVVVRVLEHAPRIETLTVMTQKEVGHRLVATPGSKTYGRVSVIVRYFAEAKVAGSVSRRAFWPVPGVDSVIVRIERRRVPEVDRSTLFSVVRAAFGHRRKTLRNAIGPLTGSRDAQAVLERAGIPPDARAEELDLDAFVRLTEALK